MGFIAKLGARWAQVDSLLCVGLDPDPAKLPQPLRGHPDALFEFGRAIIEATHEFVCAYKPQIAHYAAQRGEEPLARTLEYLRRHHPDIPLILDAKRGDIGSTAEQYAVEAFERYGADAVTVNPYLGGDALEPFTRRRDRGVVILCRTSNPGARDLQDLEIGGEPLYLHVARKAAREWNAHGNCMLVVGATWPEPMRRVRALVGAMPLLVPGVGAQGGNVPALVQAGRTADGTGLVINSSRGILYASGAADFAQAARRAAQATRDEINRCRR
ncbi:MAG: orotidine-5'-phosphate decarboxylase [Gammaproteobacteria bacterium]|nr:orotidine-5'-phosphate decarboxylase [Gammaproteobacteria bacterium]